MNYEIDVNLPGRTITVCGDGEVDIVAQSGYNDISVCFEIEELREMLKQAEAHKANYDAFIANDYEDITMPEVGDSAKPDWGRHATRWGKIVKADPEKLAVLINFGGTVETEDGFKMPDQYWSSIKRIEVQTNHIVDPEDDDLDEDFNPDTADYEAQNPTKGAE